MRYLSVPLLVVAALVAALVAPSAAPAADQLWWSVNSYGTPGISRSNADGSNATTVVPQSATGLAGGPVSSSVPDPANGKLYWITSASAADPNALYSSNLDGTGATRLGDAWGSSGVASDYDTWSLSINPGYPDAGIAAKLYWVVNNVNTDEVAIYTSDLDGSNVGVMGDGGPGAPYTSSSFTYALYPSDSHPTALSINPDLVAPDSSRIWWTNMQQATAPDPSPDEVSIGYANLDGSSGDGSAPNLTCTTLDGTPLANPTPNVASSLAVEPDPHGYGTGWPVARIYAQMAHANDSDGWYVGRFKRNGDECVRIVDPAPAVTQAAGATYDQASSVLTTFQGTLADPFTAVSPTSTTPATPQPLLISPSTPGPSGSARRYPFMVKAPKLPGPARIAPSAFTTGSTLTLSHPNPLDNEISMRVYRGAQTTGIKWYRDGNEIPGETGTTLAASTPGTYRAVYSAGNFAGTTSLTSNPVTITDAAPPEGQLWWGNRNTTTAGLARSAMDGSGATTVLPQSVSGRVNTSVPDPARNKLYWMERGTGKLWSAGLDGSNPSVILEGAGAGIDPAATTYSLSIDPVAQKLYWVTQQDWSIRWAATDGSQYGTLYSPSDPSVSGNLLEPNQIVVDREHGRIWWSNYFTSSSAGETPSYGYANLDGSGDSQAIDISCVSPIGGPTIAPDDGSGMVVDYASRKIYGQVELAFDPYGHFMAESNLDGSACRQMTPPYTPGQASSRGLTMDPDTEWLYNAWGRSTAPLMSYIDVVESPNPISSLPILPSAAANGARWPFIIKAPRLVSGTIAVSASGSVPGSQLTLAGAETVDDQLTMRVFRGAAVQSVKWFKDGVEIAGESGRTLKATEPGVYKAVFSAGNVAGDTTATSNEVTISAEPAPTPDPGPGPEPGPTPPPSNSFTAVTAATPSGTIVTAGRVPGAGKLRQVATRRSHGRRVAVCSTTKVTSKAGRFRLSCKPNAATRRAQRKGRVRVRVRVTYTPDGGSPRTLTRYVWLRSLKPHFSG